MKLDGDSVGEIVYADDLFEGDIAWIDGHLVTVKFCYHDKATDTVHITARDIFSDAAVIPFPLNVFHLVEVWERCEQP